MSTTGSFGSSDFAGVPFTFFPLELFTPFKGYFEEEDQWKNLLEQWSTQTGEDVIKFLHINYRPLTYHFCLAMHIYMKNHTRKDGRIAVTAFPVDK